MTADDEEDVVAYGPLPAHMPVHGSKLAVLQVLIHAVPPIKVVTDHLAIVSGIARGRKWCLQACRPHADVGNAFGIAWTTWAVLET